MSYKHREPHRLRFHDGLTFLPVVVLIDGAARTALAIGIHVGSAALTRVRVDEEVDEHSGLGRTPTSAMSVKLFFFFLPNPFHEA